MAGRWWGCGRAPIGEPGDFPIVLVSDLKWNEATGSFRFNARWCDEVETFDGNLTPEGLVGTVTNGARGGGTAAKVSLRKSGAEWPITSRADWASMIENDDQKTRAEVLSAASRLRLEAGT